MSHTNQKVYDTFKTENGEFYGTKLTAAMSDNTVFSYNKAAMH